MTKVLIVSRTRLRNGVCVGGIDLENKSFVRLHNAHGGNLTIDAPYQIGDLWIMSLENPWNPRERPHIEDKQVISSTLDSQIQANELSAYIQSLGMPIANGSLSTVFEGKLQYTAAGKAYINDSNIPSNSVAFWIADSDINYKVYSNKTVFCYRDKRIPFVGFQDLQTIPKGSLIRLSLAHWWQPDDEIIERRCYLQLSGWYL